MPPNRVDEWPVWFLHLHDKLPLADFDRVSIDDVEDAVEMLEIWLAATGGGTQ